MSRPTSWTSGWGGSLGVTPPQPLTLAVHTRAIRFLFVQFKVLFVLLWAGRPAVFCRAAAAHPGLGALQVVGGGGGDGVTLSQVTEQPVHMVQAAQWKSTGQPCSLHPRTCSEHSRRFISVSSPMHLWETGEK